MSVPSEMTDYITLAVGIFAMMNPIGTGAVFATMASNMSTVERRKTSRTCAFAVAVILLITVWIGTHLLEFFGISVGALAIAGGIIVLLMGLKMLTGPTASGTSTADVSSQIGIVPLAIPLTSGPGTISNIIAHTYALESLRSDLIASVICIVLALVIWVMLNMSQYIIKIIGFNGVDIITRVMGLILSGIAIQLMINGIIEVLPSIMAVI